MSGEFGTRPEDLESERAQKALALYHLVDVLDSRGTDFDIAFGALWKEFGHRGEMSRRQVAESWLDGTRRVDGYAWRYHLLLARDAEGALAGARDCHVIVDSERALAVVHLAHALVLPVHRGRGLGAIFQELPAVLGRRALLAEGVPLGRGEVLLAAEMEPWDPADEATVTRLVAYGRAGFSAIDPALLPYCQPDLRNPQPNGQHARPLPLLAVVRRVGHAREMELPTALAGAFVDHLYAVYATHRSASELATTRAHALARLATSDRSCVPLLPLPKSRADTSSLRALRLETVIAHYYSAPEHAIMAPPMTDPVSVVAPAAPAPVGALAGGHQFWDEGHWLDYRKQCQDFLLALGQKFVSLTWQSAIFATATSAALVTAHERNLLGPGARLRVALPAIAGLLAYWWFGWRYVRQIRETGALIAEIEERLFAAPDERKKLGLMVRLRANAPIYGHSLIWAVTLIWPLLILLVGATALL